MTQKNLDMQARTQLISPDDQRWLDFITSHPDATIFHHSAWINIFPKCFNFRPLVLIVLDNNDMIRAGVPFMKVKGIIRGLRYVSLPYTDYCQPLSIDDESIRKLANWFFKAYQDRVGQRIELRWNYPENGSNHKIFSKIKHTIQLNKDPDLVVKNFKRTHRQNIQTALRRGVRVEWGNQIEHLRKYYCLQLETRRRHGIPVQPWSFFNEIGTSIFQKNLGFVLLAYIEDECIAGLVCLHWKKHLIAKYSASKKSNLRCRPNNLLFWKGIEWGCHNGFSIFDFGRTEKSNHGLCRWKRGWGAVENPLTYSVYSNRPLKLKEDYPYKMIQSLIRKSPQWVCRLSGELFYKFLA
jgi:hypothetical protein